LSKYIHPGSEVRVDFTLDNIRKGLISEANLRATGTDVPNSASNCLPIADFSVPKNQLCAGGSVQLFANDY
jgi:hypothetical protein